jgi:hypothetical protein
VFLDLLRASTASASKMSTIEENEQPGYSFGASLFISVIVSDFTEAEICGI